MRRTIIFSLLLLLFPLFSEASTVVRTGETVAVSADQVVEGDFYGLGGTVALSGEVTDDLLVLGGTVTMNGEVGADTTVVGGTVDIHGLVNDDVRVIGGSVTIAGEVTGNLVVVASDLKVLSTAKVGGDVLFFGAKADLSGAIGGNVLGTSEYLRIDAPISGGLDVKTRNLVLGERADIAKDVRYASALELTRAQNALVKGEIERSEPSVVVADNSFKDALIPFLITLFAALVFYLFFKRFTLRVVEGSQVHQLRAVLIGLAVVFLTPFVGLMLLVSTLGSILGVMLLLSYFVVVFLMMVLAGAVAGGYIMVWLKQGSMLSVLSVVVGVALLHALLYIPIVGPILLIPLSLLTLGVVTERLYTMLRAA